jgi:hypothetical protein
MTTTDGWRGRLRLGESRREGDLEIVALLHDDAASPPGVLLTKQAVEAGLLEIGNACGRTSTTPSPPAGRSRRPPITTRS